MALANRGLAYRHSIGNPSISTDKRLCLRSIREILAVARPFRKIPETQHHLEIIVVRLTADVHQRSFVPFAKPLSNIRRYQTFAAVGPRLDTAPSTPGYCILIIGLYLLVNNPRNRCDSEAVTMLGSLTLNLRSSSTRSQRPKHLVPPMRGWLGAD